MTETNLSLTFRAAEQADLPTVRALYQRLCAQQSKDLWSPKWIYGIYPCEEDFERRIAGRELFLAETNGQPAGGFVLLSEPDSLSLHLFGILPEYRRCGLGKKVMNYMEEEAQSRGFSRLTLDVIDGNLPAERLYESCGFHCCGTHTMMEEQNGLLHFKDYVRDLGESKNPK